MARSKKWRNSSLSPQARPTFRFRSSRIASGGPDGSRVRQLPHHRTVFRIRRSKIARFIGRGVMAERTHGISACGCSALPPSRGAPPCARAPRQPRPDFGPWTAQSPSRPTLLCLLQNQTQVPFEPNKNKGFGLNTNLHPPFFKYLYHSIASCERKVSADRPVPPFDSG